MKAKYVIICLLLCAFVSSPIVAQIELPEGTTKGIEDYNKQMEDRKARNDENNPNKDKNKGEDKSEKTKKQEQAWEKMLEDNAASFKEAASYFNTKGLNCIFLTVLYLDGYLNLVELTNREENCPRRYDLLGTQAAAIGMSTMILYCPEYLSGLTMDEVDDLVYVQLEAMRKSKDKPAVVDSWLAKLDRVIKKLSNNDPNLSEYYSAKVIDLLTRNFKPESIVTQSLEIAREMEALGCGDY